MCEKRTKHEIITLQNTCTYLSMQAESTLSCVYEISNTGALGCRKKVASMPEDIITQKEMYEILPFHKTKILQLLRSGEMPVVKIGKDYVTTRKKLVEWIESNIGKEIYYE